MSTKTTWYVYMLRCRDKTLYTGVTTDIARRLKEHEEGRSGAKYTRARRPLCLVYIEHCASRSEAQKRESEIKKLRKIVKEKLANTVI